MLEVERLVVRLLGDATHFERVMRQAEGEFKRVASNFQRIGAWMTASLSLPLYTFGALSVREFAKFDDAMTKSVSIMSGVTNEVRQQMEEQALAVSTSTRTSAENVAKSYYYLASAGLDVQQSMAALPVVERFATAGAFDMARATDLLTDAQSALGLTVKDASQNMENMIRVSDVLTRANSIANATSEQFALSLTTKSASALRLLNKDVEEGVSVLAVYADQGVKAELAGERLAIMLRDLQTANIKHREEWEMLLGPGAVFDQATGKMRPIADIIETLEGSLADMTDEQEKMTMQMLGFTDRSVHAISSLIGFSDKIRQYEKQLRDAGGTTEDVAKKQLTSFSAQVDIAKNKIVAMAIELGKMLAPNMAKINELLDAGLSYWQGLNDEQKRFVVNVGQVVAATGPLLLLFATMSKVTYDLGHSMATLATTILSLFKMVRWSGLLALLPFIKIIAIVALVTGVIAGLLYLIVGPEGLKAAWGRITEAVSWFVDRSLGFLYNWKENVSRLWTWFSASWDTILLDAMDASRVFALNMAHNIGVAIKTAVRLWAAFLGWWQMATTEVVRFLFSEKFQEFVRDAMEKIWQGIWKLSETILKIWTAMSSAIIEVFSKVPEIILKIMSKFGVLFISIMDDILSGRIPDPVKYVARFTVEASREMASAARDAGLVFMEKTKELGVDLLGAMEQLGEDYKRGASNINFAETAQEILNEGMAELKHPLAGFKPNVSAPELLWDRGVAAPVEEVTSAVESAAAAVETAAEAAAESAVPPAVEEAKDRVEELREAVRAPFVMKWVSEGIDAIQADTVAAMVRLQQHRFNPNPVAGLMAAAGIGPGRAVEGGAPELRTARGVSEMMLKDTILAKLTDIADHTDPRNTNGVMLTGVEEHGF